MEYNIERPEYKINRSKRKTIAIIIEFNGNIQIKAPYRLSDEAIHGFVETKKEWIEKKVKANKARKPNSQSFSNGSEIQLAGRRYILELENAKKSSVELHDNILHVKHKDSNVQPQVEAFVKAFSQTYLKERMRILSANSGLIPSKVSVKTQRKRWGSCTANKHILLNWRLIFAPLDVIDYVIHHELCHLVHMDHSKSFWKLVSTFDPDFKNQKLWLKENGQIIEWPYDCVNKTL